MKEHPILFSAEMVRAILEGKKTQTRRMKPQIPEPYSVVRHVHGNVWGFGMPGLRLHPSRSTHFKCSYGQPGDRLWVRETWQLVREQGYNGPETWIEEWPRGKPIPKSWPDGWVLDFRADKDPWGSSWRPSIFMPRWASRITLEVVSVKVERVQDISEQDAVQEGWSADDWARLTATKLQSSISGNSAIDWFASLWDSINAKRGFPWSSNPWVWVVEFERIGVGILAKGVGSLRKKLDAN